MVTIREIAARAGVSTATVSNVIHGKTKRVSPQKIKEIQSLVKELGYVQKMGLRVMSHEGSRLVALLVKSHKTLAGAIGADPFYGKMIGMLEENLRQRGYYMMFYSSNDMEDIFRMVTGWDVEGVITLTLSRNDCEKIAGLTQKPVVSIDAYGETADQMKHVAANVGLDDFYGGYRMMKHLLECGYRTVFVCAHRDHGVDHQRYLGCQKAVKEWDGKDIKLQFVPLGMNRKKRNEDFAMLRRCMKGSRTALFCLSDLYALEAISFFQGCSVSVPKELGIVGFDDILYADLSIPKLTTMKQDMSLKAEMAVEVLMKYLRGENMETGREIRLPVSLVVRESALCSKEDRKDQR